MGTNPKPRGEPNRALMDVIQREREDRGWSRAELARRAGLNRETYAAAERGKGALNFTELWAVADAFGVPLHVLVERVPE